jgi:uncharacterized protein
MNIKDRIVLITGASSGIGAAFADEFHERGAKVVLVARREAKLQEICSRLNSLRPNSAEYIVSDLAGGKIEGLLEYIQSNQIEILVNNAGRGSFGYFESIPLDSELEMVALNITSTVRLAHAVIPQMKARRSGAIISLSSIAGFEPLPYMSTYAATKAFNLYHTLGLRHELAPFNVRALAVCPGPVDTEFGGVARVPGKFTGLARDSAQAVAKESIRALMKNKAYVVPCLQAKLMWFFVSLVPKTVSTYFTGKILKSTLDSVTSVEK